MTGFLLLLGVGIALVALDISGKINLIHPLPLGVYLIVACNLVAGGYLLYHTVLAEVGSGLRIAYCAAVSLFVFYLWCRLNIAPVRDRRAPSLRLRVMIGGRFLIIAGLAAMAMEIFIIFLTWQSLLGLGLPPLWVAINGIYGFCIACFLMGNGIVRMFFTSKRLSIARRIAMVFTLWIPLVNIAVLGLACRLVYEEYDFELHKQGLRAARAESDLCKTRYPLLMVHGILFRDLRFFNYWGRIPRELIRYGADVHYGGQAAVGTVATNGAFIRDRIEEVLRETGAHKVNIIAHSKGGLDARYAIATLGLGDRVASLTTMDSPHRGCRIIDILFEVLPEFFLRFLAAIFDGAFGRMGDEAPDFYAATMQFATDHSLTFNLDNPDDPRVYYQSYMCKMSRALSDTLLTLPYLMVRACEGDNDGLVAVPSAQWGNYRGLITSTSKRGISHGDIIDLKREDYRGFDVVEKYVEIVSDLKNMGY